MNPEKRRKFEKRVISIIINNYYDSKIKRSLKIEACKTETCKKDVSDASQRDVSDSDKESLKAGTCKNGITDKSETGRDIPDNDKDVVELLNEEREEVLQYALKRTENCRHMATKTFCHNCETPCYSKNMMEKITHIMKSEGKKMLLKHPLTAVRQAFYIIRSRN